MGESEFQTSSFSINLGDFLSVLDLVVFLAHTSWTLTHSARGGRGMGVEC